MSTLLSNCDMEEAVTQQKTGTENPVREKDKCQP